MPQEFYSNIEKTKQKRMIRSEFIDLQSVALVDNDEKDEERNC